jgi:broad-specificity NMP kinase
MNKAPVIINLKEYLENNKHKRIIVVGTTCTGKTTLIKKISFAQDMDEIIFSKLTKEEADYVCKPWCPEIGKFMTKKVKENIKVIKGKPLFGTVIIDCDEIIYLNITDQLLRERVKKRKASYKDAKKMQKQIKKEIINSKINYLIYNVK